MQESQAKCKRITDYKSNIIFDQPNLQGLVGFFV